VTLNSIAFNLARATGPALGGLILGFWGAGWAFALNAASFLCVVWVLVRFDEIRNASEAPRDAPTKEPLFRSMLAPLRMVRDDKRFRTIFWSVSAFAFSAASVPAMLPVLAKHSLHATATGYGVMLCAMGLGAVLSGLVLRRVRRSMGPRAVVVSAMIAYGTFVIGIGVSPSLPWVIALCVVAGMGWLGCLSTLNALAQLSSPAWIKSRMMSLYNMVFFLVWSLGATFGGALASHWNERVAIVFAGVCTLAAAVLAWRSGLPDRDAADEPASVRSPIQSGSTEIAGPKAA